MPMYEYKCNRTKCGHIFEELAAYDAVIKCPKCGRGSGDKTISTTYHPVFIHRQGKFVQRRRAARIKKR